ncbi:MAG: hypothetical protein F4X99_03015, partial [Gammaproteobacteria bacterium]|nr:hypothetical protein [Gammaproteobacteria bacterium]
APAPPPAAPPGPPPHIHPPPPPAPPRGPAPGRRPPGRVFDRAPIGSDVAHRAFVGASARICSAITALRHWVPFGALVRSASADRQLHAQQGTGRTLAPRHESRTTRVLSRSLAATGLDAASAPRHYPIPRTTRGARHLQCALLRRAAGSDGARLQRPAPTLVWLRGRASASCTFDRSATRDRHWT